MKFLSRKSGPTGPNAADKAQEIVHREIEITVQRTWTAVSARAQIVAAETPSPPGEETLLEGR
jgi:hypothetical protein